MREISWLAEELLASPEGMFRVELVILESPGIVTKLLQWLGSRLDDPGFESPYEQRFFSSCTRPDRLLCLPAFYSMDTGDMPRG